MTPKSLRSAIREAGVFIDKARIVEAEIHKYPNGHEVIQAPSRAAAAAKRASLDLTFALAEMRKP